jgi:hypothetical protein
VRLIGTIVGVVFLSLGVRSTHATAILPDPSHLVNTLYADFGGGTTQLSYTAATETLASTAVFDPNASFAGTAHPLFPAATMGRFVGFFFMAAQVDRGGHLLGGTYSWVGQDPALGIDSLQPIVSGTLLGLDPTILGGTPELNQILATVDYFNPQLAALSPQPDFLDISYLLTTLCLSSDLYSCPANPGVANWTRDFVTTGIENPDLFGYVYVSEPGTFALFGFAIACLATVSRKHRLTRPR